MNHRKASNALVATVDFYSDLVATLEGSVAQKEQLVQTLSQTLAPLQQEQQALAQFLVSAYPGQRRDGESWMAMARRLLEESERAASVPSTPWCEQFARAMQEVTVKAAAVGSSVEAMARILDEIPEKGENEGEDDLERARRGA